MSGGLTQLVAIGTQDAHLVGNPEVSFFQSAYKRHTNFAQVVERQLIQGNPGANGMSTVRFERKGDLLGYVYLAATDGSSLSWSTVVDHVELYIGGQLIDSQTYEFCEQSVDVLATTLTKSSVSSDVLTASTFYPLRFFFCENWQSALPLVALQYHDVEIRIYWGSDLHSTQYDVYANYTYLDTHERSAMTKGGIDMLVTQVQKMSASQSTFQELTFNHPIKFLLSEGTGGLTSSAKVKLQINGVDVSTEKPATPHFTKVTSYYHSPNSSGTLNNFMYPFCLDTSKLQPTGTLNFSRLDSARIVSTGTITSDVYAVNYNILRIESGMGGLRYSN